MVDENNKRNNFKKIAEKRTEAVLEKIRNLAKTSNTSHYSYDEREVSKMFAAITSELTAARSKFKKNKKNTFRF